MARAKISAKDPFFGAAPSFGGAGDGRLGRVEVGLDAPDPFRGRALEVLGFADDVPLPRGLGVDDVRSEGRAALPR